MSAAQGKRILVVEDEALIADMVVDMLAELGASVIGPAGTVSAGCALAESNAIDAAILDVNIRADRVDPVAAILRQRGIPLVFATGYGMSIGSLADGALVLEKPYTLQKLEATLSEAFRLSLLAGDVGPSTPA